MRILISGSSGFIGKALFSFLNASGHEATRLVRNQDIPDLSNFDAVINLSGRSISTRWTSKIKQEILKSRVDATLRLASASPKLFICASAIGYYGNRGDETLTEKSGPGAGFLASVCQQWETASKKEGVRSIQVRFGVVLSKEGGALARMLLLFRLGLGAIFGSGNQWMSWIALEDVVRGIEFLLHSNLEGAVNFVAPQPETNRTFSQKLARALGRPLLFRIGAKPLRWLFGEMADEMLLSSTRAVPERLIQSGFRFAHPTFDSFLSRFFP